MKKNRYNILAFAPLVIYLFCSLYLIISGNDISYLSLIIATILLVGIGYTFGPKKLKNWHRILLLIFILWFLIKGNYDKLRWFSSFIGVIVFMYYILLNYLRKKHV